jgi:putative thioredoxin
MQAVTLQNFQQEVIDASAQTPVIVNFWSARSAAAKQLSAALEKFEVQYAGRFKLASVEAEAEQQLSQHFRIQALPTVYAFVNGQPVDQLQGPQPDAAVKAFIDKLMPNPADLEFEQAMQLVEQGKIDEAVPFIKKAIVLDPAFDDARLTYAQILLQKEEASAALEQLNALSANAKSDPSAAQIIQAAQHMLDNRKIPSLPDMDARIAANPKDLPALLALAQHYIEHKAWEEALEHLLIIVQTDRAFQDEVGRRTMIEVFAKAEAQPQLVSAWRRKLSSALN